MLTEQEKASHPHLVAVRNAIAMHCGVVRSEAARIANSLSHSDCDHVLAAGDDAEKVRTVLGSPTPPEPAEEPEAESDDSAEEKPKPKTRRKTRKT